MEGDIDLHDDRRSVDSIKSTVYVYNPAICSDPLVWTGFSGYGPLFEGFLSGFCLSQTKIRIDQSLPAVVVFALACTDHHNLSPCSVHCRHGHGRIHVYARPHNEKSVYQLVHGGCHLFLELVHPSLSAGFRQRRLRSGL